MMRLNDMIQKIIFKRERTSVKADFKSFLKQNNCKCHELHDKDNKSTRFYFDYQGGHFIADIKDNNRGADISFPGIADMPVDELPLVRILCNHYNSSNTLIKFVYSNNEEDNHVHVHLSFFVNTVWPEELGENLAACFFFQRKFCDEYDALRKTAIENNTDDVERDHQQLTRERYLGFLQEIKHQETKFDDWPNNHPDDLTLDELLQHVLGLKASQIHKVEIVCGNDVVDISHNDCSKTNILKYIIEGEGKEAHFVHDKATATVELSSLDNSHQLVAIIATNEGSDEHTLFVRISAMIIPQAASRKASLSNESQLPQSNSVLVAVDKADTSQKRSEFDYMWKDAQLKLRDGEPLDETQQLIADITDPNIGYNVYWGHKLMLDGRFYEGLLHLENAFNALRTIYFNLNKEMQNTFFEICYYIGFCYTELHMYRDAYYYLDYLRDDGNIRHTSELINAMANGKDFRLFALTDNIAQAIQQQYDNEDDIPEGLRSFICFMRRRRAYAMIDHHQLDEAEKAFTAMLDDPESSDYALSELAYIKRLKEEQNNNSQ